MNIDIDDLLRPQSTFRYNQQWTEKPFEFPNLYIQDSFPIKTWDPVDTYAMDHNARFQQRYFSQQE